MPDWLQHLLVAVLVIACVAIIARQFVRTFSFKGGKLGACCAKGCQPNNADKSTTDRPVHFLPADLLRNSARRR